MGGTVSPAGTDLIRVAFPRAVDVVRALLGEIEALTATGDPPGEDPDFELVVQLRARRIAPSRDPAPIRRLEPGRLTLQAANGSLTLELEDEIAGHLRD